MLVQCSNRYRRVRRASLVTRYLACCGNRRVPSCSGYRGVDHRYGKRPMTHSGQARVKTEPIHSTAVELYSSSVSSPPPPPHPPRFPPRLDDPVLCINRIHNAQQAVVVSLRFSWKRLFLNRRAVWGLTVASACYTTVVVVVS